MNSYDNGIFKEARVRTQAPQLRVVRKHVRARLAQNRSPRCTQIPRLALGNQALELCPQVIYAYTNRIMVMRIVRFSLHLGRKRCEELLTFGANRSIVKKAERRRRLYYGFILFDTSTDSYFSIPAIQGWFVAPTSPIVKSNDSFSRK